MVLIFFNCEGTYDLTVVPAPIYYSKPMDRPFDTIRNVLKSLSHVQSLLKDRNAPICRQREPTHLRLSGTEGLTTKIEKKNTSETVVMTVINFRGRRFFW